MTTEQVIFRKKIKTASGKELQTEYALTCTFEDEQPEYGVLVRTVCEEKTEQACVLRLTRELLRAAALLRTLAEGSVTPCTVMDVIQDWL